MHLLAFVLQSVWQRPRSGWVALLAAGAAGLLTAGVTLVGSVYDGTRRSIIESGAGYFQAYHASSPDAPVVIQGAGASPELQPIPDFGAVEKVLRDTPGVVEVVPMELGAAEVFRGNHLDQRLAAYRRLLVEPPSAERDADLERSTSDLRRLIAAIARDDRQRDQLFVTGPSAEEDRRRLTTATSDVFWERFARDPDAGLEYLENNVSKQLGEGESILLEYIGVDLATFSRAFDRVEVVAGSLPPPMTRGILLGHAAYEESFRLPIAHRLDQLARARNAGASIAGDERLRAMLERNLAELPRLLLALDATQVRRIEQELSGFLGVKDSPEALLRAFLTLDDDTFDDRHRFFLERLAKHLPMYSLLPGDMLTLRPMSDRAGVRVKFYGTIRFRGLGSDTDRVNYIGLLDPLSAQQLALRQTREEAQEALALIEEMELPPPPAIDDLVLEPASIDEVGAPADGADAFEPIEAWRGTGPGYTTPEVYAGGVMQAAILLAEDASPEAVRAHLLARAREAGMPIALSDWSQSGGMVSQVVELSRVVLAVVALVLAAIVMLVVLCALLLMGGERIGEVGTLRAIGMQRSKVFGMLMMEGALLGGAGAVLGACGTALVMAWGWRGGIPVSDSSLQFFVGGPRLLFSPDPWQVLGVSAFVALQVVLAALYPAWRGGAVSPRVAISRGES
ncbi:MAG: FtsX-like permease family protein [Myxococcaceae bacterium]